MDAEQDRKLGRLRAWVAVIVSIAGAVIAICAWAWGQASASAHEAAAEDAQTRRIETLERDLGKLREDTTEALRRQEKHLRDLGALQLEQGADARQMLLETLPTRVRDRYRRKSPALRSAEDRVRRQ